MVISNTLHAELSIRNPGHEAKSGVHFILKPRVCTASMLDTTSQPDYISPGHRLSQWTPPHLWTTSPMDTASPLDTASPPQLHLAWTPPLSLNYISPGHRLSPGLHLPRTPPLPVDIASPLDTVSPLDHLFHGDHFFF